MNMYPAAEWLRKTLFLGIILLGVGQGLFSQDMKTDFTNPQEAPLVTRGDFVIRGSVLVSYTGKATTVVIPGNLGITEIGDNALSHSQITSVTIPEGVQIIRGAFANCYYLTDVQLPASLTLIGDWAFASCVRLTSIVIPNSVVSIGFRSFALCEKLTRAVIPNSVVSIGYAAFADCAGLTSFQVDRDNPRYESFEGVLFTKNRTALVQYPAGNQESSYTIPNRVTQIGAYAFAGGGNLTNVVIPNSVSSIGNYAFWGCENLTSAVLPNWVSSIGYGAFYGCRGLTKVVIPSSVRSIENNAFAECSNLTSVTLSQKTAYTADGGNRSFPGGAQITYREGQGLQTDFTNPQEATLVTQGDFVLRGSVLVSYIGKATKVVIPGNLGITEIGDNALSSNTITSVTIPEGVKTLGRAFGDYSSLQEIRLPASLTAIGNGAFWGCSGLTSVVIPNSVASIGNYAFSDCSSLTSIEVDGRNPQYASIGGVLFTKDRTTLIKYPEGKQDPAYTIPNTVNTIGGSAFSGCSGLTSVTLSRNTKFTADGYYRSFPSGVKLTYSD